MYHIGKVGNDETKQEWRELIAGSNQNTPFLRDDYLSIVGFDSIKYIVYRKDKPYMGLCMPVLKQTGEPVGVVPYAPYQGLIYSCCERKYSDYHNNLEATTVLLDWLYSNRETRSISFSNSYEVVDIRAVQWHHYHQPELGMYKTNLWYTSVLDLSGDYLNRISHGRKSDERYAETRYGITCEPIEDIKTFLNLYDKTFSRQGISLSSRELEMVDKITELAIAEGFGELWAARDDEGTIIDTAVFLCGKETGYYLFGANDPDKRKFGGATLLLLKQMLKMKEKRIRYFDFIGINSPQRGDFKLSFGGAIRPYFECHVEYPD